MRPANGSKNTLSMPPSKDVKAGKKIVHEFRVANILSDEVGVDVNSILIQQPQGSSGNGTKILLAIAKLFGQRCSEVYDQGISFSF